MVDQHARETALGEIARYSLSEAASLAGGLCLIPQNLRSDLEALFIGAMKKPSAQDKHLKRTGWIRQHLREVTEYLGLQGDDWSVVPLMVLSRAMHSPLLGHAKLKVLTLEELKLGASLA